MHPLEYFKYHFRRSPVVRAVTWLLLLVLAIVFFGIITRTIKRKPVIESMNPLIGLPGDEMTITGHNFGAEKESSYVEIAGSRITASGYSHWSDKEIRLVLPSNVQDGLVFVGTSSGKSEPVFFANSTGIPVAVKADPAVTIPVISSITPDTACPGQIISILGTNFGGGRGNSRVFFTANREGISATVSPKDQGQNFIEASVAEMDYESWNDSEIRVRVPDGAASGSVYVETSRGSSVSKKIEVKFPNGQKTYSGRRTYVIQTSTDIETNVAGQESVISLYIPKPTVSSFQPSVQLNECIPEPFIGDDSDDMIYKINLGKVRNNKQKFTQSYVVSAYDVKSNIKGKNVGQYRDKNSIMYMNATSSDPIIPAKDPSVSSLAEAIIGKARSPYDKAYLIYKYMTENYKVVDKLRSGDVEVKDIIKKKRGDAYDMAIMYASLCRAGGVAAMPVAGILIQSDSTTKPHWWVEVYFERYGWFPVDPALGAGLEFNSFVAIDNPVEYYFGNMDSQHIAFSRGWKQIRQSAPNTKIVYRPRSYAFQSIWEEASDEVSSYSSLWNNPVILGIY